MTQLKQDRHFIAACRHLMSEYGSVFDIIGKEIDDEQDQPIDGDDAFKIAKETIKRQAAKDTVRLFINKIKHYGNQRPE